MKPTQLTGWRKIANARWRAPSDPQIYGALDVDAMPALEFIERARAQGHRMTVTHLVGRAVARALVAVPELKVRLVGDHAIPRESVDVFFITGVANGHDLTGVKISNIERKTVLDVSKELDDRSSRMKAGTHRDFARVKRTMDALPRPILRVALQVSAWITGDHARAFPRSASQQVRSGAPLSAASGCLGCRWASPRSRGCTEFHSWSSSGRSATSPSRSRAASRFAPCSRSPPRSIIGMSMARIGGGAQ
jgi:pyruvate dehydrogenase E2 component (dihydrolipoamide acetyltransferase)